MRTSWLLLPCRSGSLGRLTWWYPSAQRSCSRRWAHLASAPAPSAQRHTSFSRTRHASFSCSRAETTKPERSLGCQVPNRRIPASSTSRRCVSAVQLQGLAMTASGQHA